MNATPFLSFLFAERLEYRQTLAESRKDYWKRQSRKNGLFIHIEMASPHEGSLLKTVTANPAYAFLCKGDTNENYQE